MRSPSPLWGTSQASKCGSPKTHPEQASQTWTPRHMPCPGKVKSWNYPGRKGRRGKAHKARARRGSRWGGSMGVWWPGSKREDVRHRWWRNRTGGKTHRKQWQGAAMWKWKPSEGTEQGQHGHIYGKGRSLQQQDFGQTKNKGNMQETTKM